MKKTATIFGIIAMAAIPTSLLLWSYFSKNYGYSCIALILLWLSLFSLLWPRTNSQISVNRTTKRRLTYKSGIIWIIIIQVILNVFFDFGLWGWLIEILLWGFLLIFIAESLPGSTLIRYFIAGITVGLPLATLMAKPLAMEVIDFLTTAASKTELQALDLIPALTANATAIFIAFLGYRRRYWKSAIFSKENI